MRTDVLDTVPQVRQDWANHVVYGGILGIAVLCALAAISPQVVDVYHADLWALLAVFLVAAAKKTFDYVYANETLAVCVGKALVTCVWPLSIYLTGYLPN
jgi:hypothetical protein